MLVPLELGDAGWSAAAIAAAFIGAAAIETVVAPFWGRFSDRRGRLLPLRIALAGGIVVTSALALADRPWLIVALLVATAVTFGAFWAPAMALLADGAERMGLAQGLAFGLLNASWGAGNSVGPPSAARSRTPRETRFPTASWRLRARSRSLRSRADAASWHSACPSARES